MNLLDDLQVSIEIPNKARVTQQATYLLKQNTTRRSKHKKKMKGMYSKPITITEVTL
jgi:hypothetical protein